MKINLVIVLAAAALSITMLGITAFAKGIAPTERATNFATPTRYSMMANNTDRNEYMRERQKQYEAYVDEQVAKGELTQAEADALKGDFQAMADYCNRVMGSGSNSGARRFGCH